MNKTCLSPNAHIGPAVSINGRTMFYLNDSFRERTCRLGVNEKKLLDLLLTCDDKTIEQNTKLNAFKSQLLKRGFITQENDITHSSSIPASRPRLKIKNRFEIYFRLFSISNQSGFISSRTRIIDLILFIVTVIIILGFEINFLISLRSILNEGSRHIVSIKSYILFILFTLIDDIFHEGAHAFTYYMFGGTHAELGIMFRYIMLMPYTKMNDLIVMHSKIGRILTTAAGPLASLLTVALVFFMFRYTNESEDIKTTSRVILLFYHPSIFLNFLPFLRFDGYYLLSLGIGRPELRQEAKQATKAWLQGKIRFFSSKANIITYGILSYLITFSIITLIIYNYIHLINLNIILYILFTLVFFQMIRKIINKFTSLHKNEVYYD